MTQLNRAQPPSYENKRLDRDNKRLLNSLLWHLIAFTLPLTQLVVFNIGGSIYGQDILGLLILLLLIGRKGAINNLRPAKTFLLFAFIWFFGQVLTDLIRATSTDDIVRGWSKIIFFILQFLAIMTLTRKKETMFLAYFLGFALAMIAKTLFLQGAEADYPWKFGLGNGLLFLSCVLSIIMTRYIRNFKVLQSLPMMVPTVLCLLHDARSMFGIGLISTLYTYLANFTTGNRALRRRISPIVFVIVICIGAALSQGIIGSYSSLASSGALGDEARKKNAMQSSAELNPIQSGRMESLVSIVAVQDSPIIGHGSWAKDIRYRELLEEKLTKLGIPVPNRRADADLIPTHSHLFGAWVEAGITGALFWGWALLTCLVALYWVLKGETSLNPLATLSAVVMLWDIPFSPFGADVRFSRAAQLVLLAEVIWAIKRSQRTASIAPAQAAASDNKSGLNTPASAS